MYYVLKVQACTSNMYFIEPFHKALSFVYHVPQIHEKLVSTVHPHVLVLTQCVTSMYSTLIPPQPSFD